MKTSIQNFVILTWLSTNMAISMNISCSSLILFSSLIMSAWRASISARVCFACCVSMIIWKGGWKSKLNISLAVKKYACNFEIINSLLFFFFFSISRLNDCFKNCYWISLKQFYWSKYFGRLFPQKSITMIFKFKFQYILTVG